MGDGGRSEYMKAWYEANKEKHRAKAKAYYEANKEKKKAYDKSYRKVNREKIQTRMKAYYESNKDKLLAQKKAYYESNKDKLLAQTKVWQQNNKNKRKASKAKRRSAKLQRTPSWLTKEALDKIKDIYKMAYRRSQIEGIEYQVDHIIPLQGKKVSGLHVPNNLQVISAKENRSKLNKYEVV